MEMLATLIPKKDIWVPSRRHVDISSLSSCQWSSDVKDQGEHESCTAFACCAALEILSPGLPGQQDESERFIWYNAKHADRAEYPDTDRGTNLAAVISVLQNLGSCWEFTCPYTETHVLDPPSHLAYEEAKGNKVLTAYKIVSGVKGVFRYVGNERVKDPKRFEQQQHRIQGAIKWILAKVGLPVIITFTVTDKLLDRADDNKGDLPLLSEKDLKKDRKDHAVVIVGYDEDEQMFIFRNSYGAKWGNKGFGRMPYRYTEHTSDAFLLCGQGPAEPDSGADAGARIRSVSSCGQQSPGDMLRQQLRDFFTITDGQQPKDIYRSYSWGRWIAESHSGKGGPQ